MGDELSVKARNMKKGEILLIENTRFMDVKANLESGGDVQLAMYWASLGQVYVDDAFGSMHRSHASVTGIPKYLPSCAGFLVEKELENLKPVVECKQRPFVVVMGGAN